MSRPDPTLWGQRLKLELHTDKQKQIAAGRQAGRATLEGGSTSVYIERNDAKRFRSDNHIAQSSYAFSENRFS